MKGLLTLIACAAAIGMGAFVGCSSESSEGNPGAATSGGPSTGASTNAACNGAFPDGFCNVGQDAETCECQDCMNAGLCTGRCVDDGSCTFQPGVGEDCSCADCAYKVSQCPGGDDPRETCDNGDDENPTFVCTIGEACICPDCSGEPQCNNCLDNGSCEPLSEGCGCPDCAGSEVCTGGPSSSSAGGSGEGGAGGSVAASSVASTSGAGGGSGGGGGAGGV